MKAFHEKYRRLAKTPFGLSSLWLADDHLVYVKGKGLAMALTEEYKRFRLSEIQSFSIARTSRLGKTLLFLSLALVSAMVATLVFALTETLRPVTVVVVSLALVAGLLSLALLLRHLVLGPTCVCDLQTRLTRERLRPLGRYHRAREFVQRMEPLVRESQSDLAGAVASGEVPEGMVQLSRVRETEFFHVPKPVPIAFGLFALLGLGALTAIHLESLALTGGILFLLVVASLLLTLALVSVVRKPTPESIRAVLWVLMGLHFLVVGIGMVFYLVAAMREPAYTVGLTGPLEAFTAVASEGGMVLYGVFVGLFLGYAAVGVWGVLLSEKWRRQIRAARALSDGPAASGEEAAP
ncbi:MAG TPA: hypothetical protein PLA50_13280 [Bacteroidia bacterium]|nr:hypothetical protein [Bacteroidia bacterium]